MLAQPIFIDILDMIRRALFPLRPPGLRNLPGHIAAADRPKYGQKGTAEQIQTSNSVRKNKQPHKPKCAAAGRPLPASIRSVIARGAAPHLNMMCALSL